MIECATLWHLNLKYGVEMEMEKRKRIEPISLNVKDAAQYLGLSKGTLDRWRQTGNGPNYKRAGGRILYLRKDLIKWLDGLENGIKQ
jgi:predicted DNA-binding transcriptional regulator AlpA